jgi:PKHD-type hydroxylase|tara:strand:- start:861 stop:1469 length:609 start_codon:yes stop_codon:yes gene_type:complete
MNYKKLFYYFDSAFSPFLCDKIIEEGYSNNPDFALTGKAGYTRSKKEIEKTKEIRNSNVSWINDWWVKKELEPYVKRANEMAGWNFNFTKSEASQFTIYEPGEYYDWHRDAQNYPYTQGEQKGLIRKLSVTVSLSNPEDYEGGFLEFSRENDFNKKYFYKVREILPRGSICVFPSYTWHRVSPVTKGKRLSLVQWNLGDSYV